MLERNRNSRITVKRQLSGNHFIHGDTKRIDITLCITESTSRLFRRGIMYRTHYICTNGIRRCCFCNTKIGYFNFSFFGNNNILWLNITMNNIIIVGCVHSRTHLHGNANDFFRCQSSLFLDVVFQSDTFYQLHYYVVKPTVFSYIIYIHDIRMSKSSCRLSLRPEFFNKILILTKLFL